MVALRAAFRYTGRIKRWEAERYDTGRKITAAAQDARFIAGTAGCRAGGLAAGDQQVGVWGFT